jgi:hypothetical protein
MDAVSLLLTGVIVGMAVLSLWQWKVLRDRPPGASS